MKCRSLKTLKTREFHIKRGEIYDFKVYGIGIDQIDSGRTKTHPYEAVVITNEKNESFTTNPKWFSENFITLEEERDIKLNDILK